MSAQGSVKKTSGDSPTYRKAGVDIEAGESLVEKIKSLNPQIGGFAGLYPLDDERFLVACTDGVGTKLELSIEQGCYEDLGQDLVAMSVNDLVVCGGRPLFFLDYYATGKLDVTVAHRVIQGISRACAQTGCILLGGETAEMPGFYKKGQFDLAGFAVGEVLRKDVVDGRHIQVGDVIVGLPSSGFHANGYSLVRKILKDKNILLNTMFEGESWGNLLTRPTRLYVKDVLRVQATLGVRGMAHITGGGLSNIQRVLPEGLTYRINHKDIPTPAFMKHLQQQGDISEQEAFQVWNMGMGFIFVVSPKDVPDLQGILVDAFVAGEVVAKDHP